MTKHFPRALRASGARIHAEQSAEQLFRDFQSGIDSFKAHHNERLDNMEAALNTIGAGNGVLHGLSAALTGASHSWGNQVVNSEALTLLRNAAGKATAQFDLNPQAAITSIGTSGGSLVTPDRVEGVQMARRRLTVRALLGTGTTQSNMVEYPRQTTRDNQAATVAELALKPESNLAWELKQAKVATIAHWVGASRQVLDDAGQLRTLIDGELRYGLALREEMQLLLGDGVGTNVLGLVPQATAYNATVLTSSPGTHRRPGEKGG